MPGIDRGSAFVKSVGVALRHLRESERLTQSEFAARLQSGGLVSGSSSKTVSAWERGETPIPLPALPVIADALRLDPGALGRSLGLCGDPTGPEIRRAEAAGILGEIDALPDEIVDDLMLMLRTSLAIAKGRRLVRDN